MRSQQYPATADTASTVLGYRTRTTIYKLFDIILVCLVLLRPQLEYLVQFQAHLNFFVRQRKKAMSQIQFFKAAKPIRDLENTIYEVRLNEMGLFSLERSGLKGDNNRSYLQLRGNNSDDGMGNNGL